MALLQGAVCSFLPPTPFPLLLHSKAYGLPKLDSLEKEVMVPSEKFRKVIHGWQVADAYWAGGLSLAIDIYTRSPGDSHSGPDEL